MFIPVYVDDILITGSSIEEMQNLVTELNVSLFSYIDLRDLNYFLGIEVLQILLVFIFHKQSTFQTFSKRLT